MKFAAYLIFLVGSMASAEILNGNDAKSLLGKSTILESSIDVVATSGNTLTDDDLLILGKRNIVSLVQNEGSVYLCDQTWEKVTGGNDGSEPYWRQASIVCSN